MVIRDGKIANYHPYPPTPWNANPRDSYGTPGPYEDAVQGQPIFEENDREHFKGIDIMRTVRSFDPCLPCGVHMYLGEGKTLEMLHSPTQSAERRVTVCRRRRTPSPSATGAPPASGSTHCWSQLGRRSRWPASARRSWSRLVADLYGAGLERLLEIVHDAGRLDDDVARRARRRTTWSPSLLLVHGLHPYGVSERVEQRAGERPAVPRARTAGTWNCSRSPTTGSVRLRLLGSCDGCASSSVTLELAVEGAIEAAAPEITGIEVARRRRGAARGHGHTDRRRCSRASRGARDAGRRVVAAGAGAGRAGQPGRS